MSIEKQILLLRDELLKIGVEDSTINLWCQYDQFTEGKGSFNWVLFFFYCGQKHYFDGKCWDAILTKVRGITCVDLATREVLLSL